MRAMVLCAGLGTRLRPLTLRWPKPALPFFGHPLARYALAVLKAAGVAEVGFNTHHLPDAMAASFQAACAAVGLPPAVQSHEPELLGTGGGVAGLRDFLGGDVSVVFNGDALFGVDLAPALAAHRASGAVATMVLLPMPEGEKFNPVEMTPQGEVRRIAGVGPGGPALAPWHFSGVHILSPELWGFTRPGVFEDINRDVYPRAMAAGKVVRGHVVSSGAVYWSDIGTPERYLASHADVLFGRVSPRAFPGCLDWVDEARGRVAHAVEPGAQVGDARVAGPAWFGAGCVLEPGVRVGAAVSVGRAARVGAGAHLNRVAVLDGAEVPAGALLEDCLVGPGGVVVPAAATTPRASEPARR